MSLVVEVIGFLLDAAMTLMTDQGQTDSIMSGQSTQIVVVVAVLRQPGVAENHQGGAVGRGSVKEVGVVRVIDEEVAVAAVHQVDTVAEHGGADQLRGGTVIAVHRQTLASTHSRHLVEWTCQAKVTTVSLK